jgi:hypothetical protein
MQQPFDPQQQIFNTTMKYNSRNAQNPNAANYKYAEQKFQPAKPFGQFEHGKLPLMKTGKIKLQQALKNASDSKKKDIETEHRN